MSNGTIPRGPALEFRRDRKQPCVFPLTSAAGVAYEPAGVVYFRLYQASASEQEPAAAYQVALDRVEAGLWSCTPDPAIATGAYRYVVYDVAADRDLVIGAATVEQTAGAPA